VGTCLNKVKIGVGGVVQVVLCLPSKHEALSSNASLEKNLKLEEQIRSDILKVRL
jgi:hypothetical protein